MRRFLRSALEAWWSRFERHAESRYVAGSRLEDALDLAQALGSRGVGVVLCRWNAPHQAGRSVADAYLGAMEATSSAGLDGYVSVKAPALDFSPPLVEELATKARRTGLRLHFDAQRWEHASATMDLIRLATGHASDIGCTLPGRWQRSVDDVRWASDNRLFVRVVKGESADGSGVEAEPRQGFLRVIAALAKSQVRQVGVATHDAALARAALGHLLDEEKACELELLLGLPMDRCLSVAAELGVRVRVYLPYGVPSMRYHYSDLRRDPRVLGWFVQDLVSKPAPPPLPKALTTSSATRSVGEAPPHLATGAIQLTSTGTRSAPAADRHLATRGRP